eukprot:TRINITY_DN3768_c0_g1_i3.p1 TRINITY_DN3768_c0_g1~~TRINITY_DN3768_c0_g1_i3.p1  ORF type:complete len:377 (-),score=68.69 TRINITY_DN3768_c0_g1_i3:203-1333(-)
MIVIITRAQAGKFEDHQRRRRKRGICRLVRTETKKSHRPSVKSKNRTPKEGTSPKQRTSTSKKEPESLSNIVIPSAGEVTVTPMVTPASPMSPPFDPFSGTNNTTTSSTTSSKSRKSIMINNPSSGTDKNPKITDTSVDMLNWNFDELCCHPRMKCISNNILIWDVEGEWGLARGNNPIITPKSSGVELRESKFFEITKLEGSLSNNLRIGVCGKNLDFQSTVPQSLLSPTILPGTWVCGKVIPPLHNKDVVGVLFSDSQFIYIFKNYQLLTKISLPSTINEPLYPFFAMCNNIHIKITTSPQVSKYNFFIIGDKQCDPKNITIDEFLKALGVVKFKPLFSHIKTISELTKPTVRALAIPTVLKKKILAVVSDVNY